MMSLNFSEKVLTDKRKCKIIICGLLSGLLLIVIVSTLLVVYLAAPVDSSDDNEPAILHFVNRSMWKAQIPKEQEPPLKLPIVKVIILHTDGPQCFDFDTCTARVKSIQQQHIDRPSIANDIGYNFLISSEGVVYEGRGWLTQGAHVYSKCHFVLSEVYNRPFRAPAIFVQDPV